MSGPNSIRRILKRAEKLTKHFGKGLLHLAAFRFAAPSGAVTTEEYLSRQIHGADRKTTLTTSKTLRNQLPMCGVGTLPSGFVAAQEVSSPEQYVVSVEQGRVFGRGVIVTPSNEVLKDLSFEFSSPRQSHSLCNAGRLPKPKYFPGKLGIVSSRSPSNYYHWLYDILPKFGLLSAVEVDAFYVDNETPFQRQYLDLLGIERDRIVPAGRYKHWEAEIVQATSLPGSVGNPSEESVAFLRQLRRFGEPKEPRPMSRIYIGRGDVKRRKVQNEQQVINELKRYGFSCVTLSGLSVVEQIALFANAEVVVSPHGAGLSNLVYCNRGVSVIELFAPKYVNVCYWALSQRCGLRYSYLLGDDKSVSAVQVGHPNAGNVGDHIKVDLSKLNASVRDCLERRSSVAA